MKDLALSANSFIKVFKPCSPTNCSVAIAPNPCKATFNTSNLVAKTKPTGELVACAFNASRKAVNSALVNSNAALNIVESRLRTTLPTVCNSPIKATKLCWTVLNVFVKLKASALSLTAPTAFRSAISLLKLDLATSNLFVMSLISA